jgi:hypothetical protein
VRKRPEPVVFHLEQAVGVVVEFREMDQGHRTERLGGHNVQCSGRQYAYQAQPFRCLALLRVAEGGCPALVLNTPCDMTERWRNNGLSISLTAIFVVFMAGQTIAGHRAHNQELTDHGQLPISLSAYLGSAHFYEATFENWESEFLQMAVFVLITTMLYQVGSSESKRPGVVEPVDVDPRNVTHTPDTPWPVRRGGLWLMVYENSLGLAFLLLFIGSIGGHAISGAAEHNADARLHGGETVTVLTYVAEPRFWFESFQNWQSEFLALIAMIVLSIFLRQRGSPESKPVYAPHWETGK